MPPEESRATEHERPDPDEDPRPRRAALHRESPEKRRQPVSQYRAGDPARGVPVPEQDEAEGKSGGADERVRQRVKQAVQAAADEPREDEENRDEKGRERSQSATIIPRSMAIYRLETTVAGGTW